METKPSPIKNDAVSVAIARAVEINHTIKSLTADLERLKGMIRAEAEKVSARRHDDTLVEFESPVGIATVCFPRDAVSPVEGANLLELKDELPKLAWHDLFDQQIVLSPGFTEKFKLLKKKYQRIVGQYVEWSARSARVILPK